MQGLEDHFGDNAELDTETSTHIANYLTRNALRWGKPTSMSRMLRNMPDHPPLRITEFPYFLKAHEEIPKKLGVEELDEGFLSPCEDCHKQAAEGIFDSESMSPGYGPSFYSGNSDRDDN